MSKTYVRKRHVLDQAPDSLDETTLEKEMLFCFFAWETALYGMSLSLGFTLVGMIPLVMAGCSGPSNVPIDASVISIF